MPPNAGIDGRSFAPRLSGEQGAPREWIHTQLRTQYFARDKKWKLRENGELYDISQSPFEEKLVKAQDGEAAVARKRLQAVLDQLHKP